MSATVNVRSHTLVAEIVPKTAHGAQNRGSVGRIEIRAVRLALLRAERRSDQALVFLTTDRQPEIIFAGRGLG